MTDCGDLVDSDNEEEVDDLEKNAEPLLSYFQPLFYYPICIGNVLAQRYRIEHKLGHGGFSTVWMAHDIVTKKDVALKVTIPAREAADPESTMHNEIRQRVRDTSKLLLSCETFSLPSPNGHHRVLVFSLRGPSLHSCFASMSMANRMSAAKQVLQALKCLHDANIVHRDLNDKNIMCGIVPLDHYDIKMKYQYLGRPKKIPLQTRAGMQGELVRPVVVPPSLLTKSVYLGDFGLAMNAGTSINYKPQSPSAWCAPERLHNTDPSAASDMWSYMCLFTELYLGTLPWSIYGDALSDMVKVLGPLPQTWYGYYHQPARTDASWYDPRKQPESTLEAMIEHARPDVSSTERAHVLAFMLKGFSYDPQDRITAAQLLCNASFQAVMGVYWA
ncbi:Serine/threonine-protein kinase SRPK [Lachnellula arida]|uniref:Serine/threonine-protein kinase SRPK n=1 Tax=Lachnellula arida TaxID=1316785 RepID=A0A8T9B4U6_9HELO|nr:Serine/threonine-protein kinase SRPK [Lachnellula arida]